VIDAVLDSAISEGHEAMKIAYRTTVILSALALSFGALSASAQVKAGHCMSAECACETALERNTVQALEEFLKEYQHDASSQTTACAALAVPAEADSLQDQNAEYTPPTLPDVSPE
jgi:hypothetical protein